MKKIKLKLSDSQMKALLLIINHGGISISCNEISDMALKEQYTKLFIKLQTRILTIKEKNNSLKLTVTECWALENLFGIISISGFELNTIKYILREIDQQIISM